MPQQRYFATILLQTPGCATLIKDNTGFKPCETTILSCRSMLIPNQIWQTCLPSPCSEKFSQLYETRFYVFSQDIVDRNNQQCHVWGGEFEIKIGQWPVISNPSLDRRLLACVLYIVLRDCCKGSCRSYKFAVHQACCDASGPMRQMYLNFTEWCEVY